MTMQTADALGRTLTLERAPQRIVSLVPSLTEFLFDIGLGECVVGVTDFCIEPAGKVATLPRVRGTKNPDRERIAALQPDLVIASKEENRERDVLALEAANIPVYVTDICTVADTLEQLTALANLLDAGSGAQPLLADLRSVLEQARAAEAGPTRRTLAFVWRDPWMAIGGDTYADDVLRLCGAANLARQMDERYPRATLEAFLALEPEIILLPSEPYHFTDRDVETLTTPGQTKTPRTPRIHLCDGMLLTWYGRRTIQALRTFRALLAEE